MTPKDKANEIITMLINDGINKSWIKFIAKISVNEIIKNMIDKTTNYTATCMYWEEVKIEIEKHDSN